MFGLYVCFLLDWGGCFLLDWGGVCDLRAGWNVSVYSSLLLSL